MTQSEIARYLRLTRQAVCAGIEQEDDYFDSNRLLRLYDALRADEDRRVVIVADRLKKQFGIEADPNVVASTVSGNPDSFPSGFKELWVFAGEPLELTIPKYVSLMRRYFGSPEKNLVYFVSNQSIGDRLARRIGLEIESIKRSGGETATVHILLCNAVMCMPYILIFDPISREAKGYVRVAGGHFAKMECGETGLLVANFVTTGVRAIEGEIIAPNHDFDGISFKVLHRI